MPTTWCPGCGLGIVMSSIAQAVHFAGLPKDKVAMVSGIGCTGRMSGYVDFNTLHTTHGRAPAFATGLKMARPDMTVIVMMGDGDSMSIGGNHLMHAMRRNIGVLAVVVNNSVYGLTGGQSSPTTPVGGLTTTTSAGSIERPMNLETLARAAGAAYYARTTVNHTSALTRLLERGLGVSGFALVEIVSNCHVLYGKMNDLGDAAQMMHAMETTTRRTNPALMRRGALPVRLSAARPEQAPAGVLDALAGTNAAPRAHAASDAPHSPNAVPADDAPAAHVHDDPRLPRGLIFERSGSVDYSRRYWQMVEARRAARDAA